MSGSFTESVVEDAALGWLEAGDWQIAHGPDIAPDMPAAERANYGEVVLSRRLRDALARLNPELPADALEDAFRALIHHRRPPEVERQRMIPAVDRPPVAVRPPGEPPVVRRQLELAIRHDLVTEA